MIAERIVAPHIFPQSKSLLVFIVCLLLCVTFIQTLIPLLITIEFILHLCYFQAL